jgi:hypothetical protein
LIDCQYITTSLTSIHRVYLQRCTAPTITHTFGGRVTRACTGRLGGG